MKKSELRKLIREEIQKLNEAALCQQGQAGQPCGNAAGAEGIWTNHYTTNSCLCIADNGYVIHDRKDWDPGAASTGGSTGMGGPLSTDDMMRMRDPRYRRPAPVKMRKMRRKF